MRHKYQTSLGLIYPIIYGVINTKQVFDSVDKVPKKTLGHTYYPYSLHPVVEVTHDLVLSLCNVVYAVFTRRRFYPRF